MYQLRIELEEIQPVIWRTILVPDTITLAKLDRVVQAAMGWANSHLHVWKIAGRRYGMPDPDWDAPGEMRDERAFTVGEVLGEGVDEFAHEYDFGDGWEHSIKIEKIQPAAPGLTYPRLLDAAGRCPPEDGGGPWGYQEMLEALADPDTRRCWTGSAPTSTPMPW